MVTAADSAWDEGSYVWDKSRMFEYTPDELRERLRPLSPEILTELTTLPTLFMYERRTEGTPRVGKIKEIQTRRTEVRIEFDFDPAAPLLTPEEIEKLQWHLEIEDFEFFRTHWAVKNADLGKALAKLPPVYSADVMSAIDAFSDGDETLEELIGAIQRDIRAGKHAATLDRLHTYCVKRFRFLLDGRSIPYDRNDALHSLVGKYVKALRQSRSIPAITDSLMRSWISALEELNTIRNNNSLAHDNELLGKAEAIFIFEAVAAILKFIKSIEEEPI